MLLSYHELMQLLECGVIDAHPNHVNGASIDVTLDSTILVEKYNPVPPNIDMSIKQFPEMVPMLMTEHGFSMKPGQFILASTQETFNLPNTIACEFKLKSSIARGGLNNMLAGHADPGWHNSKLTLELHNCLQYNNLVLKPGMKIGQIKFYRVNEVPESNSYAVKGRYNNTMKVTASKGV